MFEFKREPELAKFNHDLTDTLINFNLNDVLLDDVSFDGGLGLESGFNDNDSDIPYAATEDPLTNAEHAAVDFSPFSRAGTPHHDVFGCTLDVTLLDVDDSIIPPSSGAEGAPATAPSTPSSRRSSPSRSASRRASPSRPHGIHHCADCARDFTSDYTLSKHMRTHLPKSQRSFPCTMGCTMNFSRRHDRLRHEIVQHGKVCETQCKLCLGYYSSAETLRKHKCKARARP
ncbi:hypothetical protein C8R44DRAFT_893701 [Mycena epipterygia]|nr:hypothetical protein C8R44DRAFT_893701 [Mycena epipterygia]